MQQLPPKVQIDTSEGALVNIRCQLLWIQKKYSNSILQCGSSKKLNNVVVLLDLIEDTGA